MHRKGETEPHKFWRNVIWTNSSSNNQRMMFTYYTGWPQSAEISNLYRSALHNHKYLKMKWELLYNTDSYHNQYGWWYILQYTNNKSVLTISIFITNNTMNHDFFFHQSPWRQLNENFPCCVNIINVDIFFKKGQFSTCFHEH